jgi:hypothetical protein
MLLREDFRFGDDDCTVWPQVYTTTFPHIIAIPRRPAQAKDDSPEALMWWTPSKSDFVHMIINGIKGLCNLPPAKLKMLREHVDKQSTRYKSYLQTPEVGKEHGIARSLASTLEDAMLRLETLSLTRTQVRLTLAELQWVSLELDALITYRLVYCPHIDGAVPPATEVDEVVGAFTMSAPMVQAFYRAGVPVFWIQPSMSLYSMVIEELSQPLNPYHTTLLVMDPAPKFPIVFHGRGSDPAKMKVMSFFISDYVSAAPVSKATGAFFHFPPPPGGHQFLTIPSVNSSSSSLSSRSETQSTSDRPGPCKSFRI